MKKVNVMLMILGFVLFFTPFAAKAQKDKKTDFNLDLKLYKVSKTGPERMTRNAAPYIISGKKAVISSAEAVFCTDEYCDFKFGIFADHFLNGEASSVPIIVSTINGDKKYIRQNFKLQFSKDARETRLVFKGRLFFGGENNIKIGIDPQNDFAEFDETNNFLEVFLTLAKN